MAWRAGSLPSGTNKSQMTSVFSIRITMVTTVVILLGLLSGAGAWHDPSSADEYHCWPGDAGPVTAYGYCPGVSLKWISAPPMEIKAEVAFNMTYELIISPAFYSWAVNNNGFLNNDATVRTTNATEAQNYCENTVCPSLSTAASQVKADSCCVWHVNVHSCPIKGTTSYCGPWISPSGTLFTHSQVLWGAVAQGNWTSTVAGLYVEGATQLIAHFKVGNIQITLYHDMLVLPKSECGNADCETADGETCSTCPADCGGCPLSIGAIVGIAVAGVLIVLAIAGVFGYLQWKQRKMLWDESWIIPYEAIKADNTVRGFMGSAVEIKDSSNSKDMFGGNALAQQAADKQVFCKTGIFNGKTLAVTDIKKVNFTLNKAIRIEVKAVRSLDHPNVARFVGGVIQVPYVCIGFEYCPKGGLPDILQNDDVPLNWGFRFSFAGDIAKGMNYLHSCGVLHGHLKSNNCIVDDRWTVKITDYGLFNYREEEWSPTDPDYEDYLQGMTEKQLNDKRCKVYKAPETMSPAYTKPAPEADVYAFAIILLEIATRSEPYGDEDPDMVDDDWKPELPSFEDDETESEENRCPCPEEYRNLINQCYQNEPSQRPDFQFVKRTLARINPSQQSPVDMMMQLMEKYSKHLESLVGERTADLIVEKQKTDRLLYSMMPRKVADDLRMGKQIDAEWFDECTIYFSDIVGFTAISGKSSPYQVVGLLNKLYTTFDSIIDSYDVYKVETIGDAYMVVSGIPVRNGIRHAHQVSCMSIDLVAASKVFVIPHLPDEPMKIRVGLHTGPACAGVVGLKMPRYCLFGDTVNTASRMESNGESYKIHISDPCHKLLEEVGGFKCDLRGTIPVKGKGEMKTWWLNGYDESAASPQQLMKEVNQEIDDVIDGKFPQREMTIDVVNDQIGFDDLFPGKNDAQRKISTISTSADSGYNEKTTDDNVDSTRLNSPSTNNKKNEPPQRRQASVGPPPVNI